MRRTAAALLVLIAVFAPGSARSDPGSAESVVGTVAGAAVLSFLCGMAVLNASEPAEEDDGFARRGWRIGVSGRYAIETFTDDLESDLRSAGGPLGSVSLSSEDSFGVSARFGYRCHRYFSVDVDVEWLDGFDSDVALPGVGDVLTLEVEPVVVTTNLKAHLLTGRFQPFLLAGIGVMAGSAKARDNFGLGVRIKETGPDTAIRLGGGLDLYATRHLVVTAESSYVRPFGELDEFDYVSIGLGLEYRF